MLKAIGIRYWLRNGIVAELFDSGTIILSASDVQEFYDKAGAFHSATDMRRPLWWELGCPENLRSYITIHGRPHGTIWREDFSEEIEQNEIKTIMGERHGK